MSRLKAFLVQIFLCFLIPAAAFGGGGLPEGRVVWWGRDYSPFRDKIYDPHTNGVVEIDNELLTNVVAIAAGRGRGVALKSDGTVIGFGSGLSPNGAVPDGLSNVASIFVNGDSWWAFKHDGTVTEWGIAGSHEKILTGLSNLNSVVSTGSWDLVALRKDGTLTGLSLRGPELAIIPNQEDGVYPFRIDGRSVRNVKAVAGLYAELVMLKFDGTVTSVRTLFPWDGPFDFTGEQPVTEQGQPLSNVTALASSGYGVLAVKSNGTVVGFDKELVVKPMLPEGLSNVMAVAMDESLSLALKKDGTVSAWGNNHAGQTSVPAGLSNVVAVASAGNFGLALTTGPVPPSVYITPHGSLEIMERGAESIFKGQAIRSVPVTNSEQFMISMAPHETTFRVISVLKGPFQSSEIRFLHYTKIPNSGSGPGPPPVHQFNPGDCYLVFAYGLDKPDPYYRPPTNSVPTAGLYRQYAGYQISSGGFGLLTDQGSIRTLDDRVLTGFSMKEAHWFELSRMLNDSNPSNQLYAMLELDAMSLPARAQPWGHSDDFKRSAVLEALAPLIASQKEEVARRAIRCFATDSNAAVQLAPFATALVKVANESPFPSCRYAAIAALSGEWGSAVSNSVAQLVSGTNEDVRLCAMTLLPRFPHEFSESLLGELANDKSPYIRSVVADVIAAGKYSNSIPIVAKLFLDSTGVTAESKGMPREAIGLKPWSNGCGDVHKNAGFALLAFDTSQVAWILKSNLNDEYFHAYFVAKLAESDVETWLKDMVAVLESRIKYLDELSKYPPGDPRRKENPLDDLLRAESFSRCWEAIRGYLLQLPADKVAEGSMVSYLDLLQKYVRPDPNCSGCGLDRVLSLYDLYKQKGLASRAKEIRDLYKTEGWRFDEYDKTH